MLVVIIALLIIIVLSYHFIFHVRAVTYLTVESWVGVGQRKCDGKWQAIRTQFVDANGTDGVVSVYYDPDVKIDETMEGGKPLYFYTAFQNAGDAIDFCRKATEFATMNATTQMVYKNITPI